MRYPEGHGGSLEPGRAEYALEASAGLLGFQGHFPGAPILPGVTQLDWAIHFGRLAFGEPGVFLGVDQLKFKEPIRPGEALTLKLEQDPERGSLRFAFRGAAGLKSSGVVRFQPRGSSLHA